MQSQKALSGASSSNLKFIRRTIHCTRNPFLFPRKVKREQRRHLEHSAGTGKLKLLSLEGSLSQERLRSITVFLTNGPNCRLTLTFEQDCSINRRKSGAGLSVRLRTRQQVDDGAKKVQIYQGDIMQIHAQVYLSNSI